MVIGPQVAFVDDIMSQIEPLNKVLQELQTGTIFFNAKPDLSLFPEEPIESIKLLFLDLYYKVDFDAELCAQWVQSIITPNTKYSLIIWSNDTHHKDELIEILDEIDLSPSYYAAWQKTDFDLEKHDFKEEIIKLINDISDSQTIEEEVIFGEIIESDGDGVLINCLLNKDFPTFQVRRFDNKLLSNITDLSMGKYVKIHIYTKPGARLINIFEVKKDINDWFKVSDFFDNLDNNSFFIEG